MKSADKDQAIPADFLSSVIRFTSRRELNSESNGLIFRVLLIMASERSPNSDPIIAIGQFMEFQVTLHHYTKDRKSGY